ncbi:MAG: acyltransferase [Candidatus Omnitrophica bacterium]|nr:acyltransferase [Candidatus Omnitrophota bacterium]
MLKIEARTWLEELFIANLPGIIGARIRSRYWSAMFKEFLSANIAPGFYVKGAENIRIGSSVNILRNCHFYAHNQGSICIKDRVSMNSNVMLGASDNGSIVIGNDVLIGPNVVFRASNHAFQDKNIPINLQGHIGGKIEIEDDVWIGANCVILPGVKIGRGSIVGAGSVVNKEILPYSLVAGVPAKVVKDNCRG